VDISGRPSRSAPAAPASRGNAPPPVVTAAGDGPLPRQLGFWSTTALTVGFIIGVGIFRAPSAVAADAGSVGRVALVWTAGGLIALCGALSIAELGAMFPRAGGIYVHLREAYGPLVAFLYGWTALATGSASFGVLALVFAEYLGTFVPLTASGARAVAAGTVLAVAAASYRSTRGASALQGTATAAKVLALAAIVVLAFALGGGAAEGALAGSSTAARLAAADAVAHPGWDRLGVALIAALWPYSGWHYLALMAGEVRDPARTFPRALITGVMTVLVLYLAVNAAYLHVLPLPTLAQSPLAAADVMRRVLGPIGSATVSALIMVSAFGTLTAGLLAVPRLYYAMAEDGLFFRRLAGVHPRFRTPHAAVTFLALATLTLAVLLGLDQLRELLVVGAWPFLTLAVLAVPVLRRRRPELPRPYRMPGSPLVPLVFLAASLALIGSAVVEHPRQTLATFGFTLLGVPAYVAWRAAGRRRAVA
jgi:basic amino acid/polyamine antiporter, APA family